MITRILKIALCGVLLLLTADAAMAQQPAELSLSSGGATALPHAGLLDTGAATSSILSIEPPAVRRHKHPKPARGNAALANLKKSLTIPNAPSFGVTGPDRSFSGFPGLNEIDNANTNGFAFEPPDQALAAGNDIVLEATNLDIAAYNANNGQRLSMVVPLNAFFGLPPVQDSRTMKYGPFLSDPRAYFDAETQRWFVTTLEIDVDPKTGNLLNRSRVFFAVSRSGNVFAGFDIYSIETTNDGKRGTPDHKGCPCFPDQPLIGADRYGFFITGNEFAISDESFVGGNVYALSKLNLAMGMKSTVVLFGDLPLAEDLAYSIQPATSPNFAGEPAAGLEYFMSSLDFTSTLDNRLAVWAMVNTSSLSHAHPNVQLFSEVFKTQTYGLPPPATQRPLAGFMLFNNNGILEMIDSGDDRLQQVVYAAGYLWAGLTTVVNSGGHPTAGIAWFVVDPDGPHGSTLDAKVVNQGYVSVAGNSVMYPSIGVNALGGAEMVFTLVGPTGVLGYPNGFFPSVAYAPLNTHSGAGHEIRLAGPGAAPDDSFSADMGIARWGDYTAATTDGTNIWIAGEFIPGGPRLQSANWGTFIGHVLP